MKYKMIGALTVAIALGFVAGVMAQESVAPVEEPSAPAVTAPAEEPAAPAVTAPAEEPAAP